MGVAPDWPIRNPQRRARNARAVRSRRFAAVGKTRPRLRPGIASRVYSDPLAIARDLRNRRTYSRSGIFLIANDGMGESFHCIMISWHTTHLAEPVSRAGVSLVSS
jgi:hypothetical protein